MSGVGARQVGEFVHQKPVIRTQRNPLDKATIVSIYPRRLVETKETLQPSTFIVEPGSVKEPSLSLVIPAGWVRDIEDQPMLEIPVSATQLAHSIIVDYCNGLLGCDMNDAMPGLFFVPGQITKMELNMTYTAELARAKVKQDNWFHNIVKLGDSLWARSNHNPLVIWDLMRVAARELGLDKAWLKDYQASDLIKCFACGGLRNPEYPICPTCKSVDPSHPLAKDLVFAK